MALDKANSGASHRADTLDGPTLRRMFVLALAWLERNAPAIDAINVFPVPDGDTGSNMTLTMRATVEALQAEPRESTGEVLASAARGALLGARGNSGVILSQWIRGLAEALPEDANGHELSRALEAAAAATRSAIGEPRDGTILSVASALSGNGRGQGLAEFITAMQLRAREAVDRTPEQLAVLAEAGVVDAGALGLAIIVEGFGFAVRGEDLPDGMVEGGAIDPGWLAQSETRTSGDGFGFCTEFVLEGRALDAGRLRGALAEIGHSVVVVGDRDLLHAHVHTSGPERAFELAAALGSVSRKKADDMSAQRAALIGEARGEFPAIAIVAVASGEGFTALFHELGVAAVIPGGPTMNPSAEAILRAAATTHARQVIVLPNDGNIVAAARQAAALAAEGGESPRLVVVPSQSQAAGVAALTAFDRNGEADANADAMGEAASTVATGAVTFAAREVETPVRLTKGQPFALLGDEIVAGAESTREALLVLVDALIAQDPDASLLTLYQGAEVESEEGQAVCAELALSAGRELEIELVIGGQPHYPWAVALE